MTGDRTLVVVDMQSHFLQFDSAKTLINSICELIQIARHQKWGIILVKFGSGPVAPAIKAATCGYHRLEEVEKYSMDGGENVVSCLGWNWSWSRNLLVCGVYGDACVYFTVGGIAERDPSVEISVVSDLVHPSYPTGEDIETGEREEQLVSLDTIKCLYESIHSRVSQ